VVWGTDIDIAVLDIGIRLGCDDVCMSKKTLRV
jgi:hypothetical protein